MPRTYGRLDLDERRIFFRLVEARRPVGEVAERLGRHPPTAYRELGRDRYRDSCGYFSLTAHDLARRRRRRLHKLVTDDALRTHVVGAWKPAGRRSGSRAGSSGSKRTAGLPSAARPSIATSTGPAARTASTATSQGAPPTWKPLRP